jgi:hypothetical protein
MQALAKRTEPKPVLQNKVNQTRVAGFGSGSLRVCGELTARDYRAVPILMPRIAN